MSLKDKIQDIAQHPKESLLDSLGLQEKRQPTDYLLPALGIFGAGLAVGAVLGLLFAPKAGREIRADIRHRVDDLRERRGGHALAESAHDASTHNGPKVGNPYAD